MLGRRRLLGLALAAPVLLPGCATPPPAGTPGRLLLVGGAEDRVGERRILRRFVELCGGPSAQILLLSAASAYPERVWQGYEPVFQGLGARRISHLDLRSRQEANSPSAAQRILAADGVYLSGGDQRRLMATLGGSASERALRLAFERQGCCIGGTSAGAAALSREMLAGAATAPSARVALEAGLGLMPQAIVDQHFSQRQRLPRLLAALGQRPGLLGLGLDEDTALLLEPGRLEVLGSGAVTLVGTPRPHDASAPVRDMAPSAAAQLHLLPAGTRYPLAAGAHELPLPPALHAAIAQLMGKAAVRG
ncbi:MAG: hypothetical protein RJA36_3319 [Pseudomonadota bacterium]|jgi:cyanophycinase